MARFKFPADMGANLFEETLMLRRDGSVELDGKRVGWATGIAMDQTWRYQSGRQDIKLRFEMYIMADHET